MKLVKYGAPWCGPCKALDHLFETANLDIEIELVNIDHNVQLAQDNNIRSIPTVVLIDDKGKEVNRFTGLMNFDDLKEFVKS
jgi:thioredoxin 1